MKFQIVIIISCLFPLLNGFLLDDEPRYYDVFGTDNQEWQIAFKGMKGILSKVFEAYTTKQTVQVEPACKELGAVPFCFHHYRNNAILDAWQDVQEVAFVVYKGTTRVAHVVFNATGTDNLAWFDHNRIITSSWTDIKGSGTNYFNIAGHDYLERRFFMEHNYGGCPSDAGWFVAVDEWLPGRFCSWERNRMNEHRIPLLLYSNITTYGNWNTNNVDVADAFIVFVKQAQTVIGRK